MSMKKIVTAAKRFDAAVARTLVQESRAVAAAIWNTFPELDNEQAESIADNIAEGAAWKGTSSEGARRSEWKKFALAVPFNLEPALAYAMRKHPSFTRHVVFTLARGLVSHGNFAEYKLVVDNMVAEFKSKKTTAGSGTQRSLTAAVKSLFSIQTRKRNEIAFRKELAKLCAKHGIDVS